MKTRMLALSLVMSLLLTACGGGGAKATTMHLKRSEGTVSVADGEGKDITPREDLGLYSGYGVDTQSESYAWIDLDEVKLTKMDQDSEIVITKEGKQLEIEVKSGSLFFHVTQPLAEDETLNIRTSSMAVGIRGTCGWVEVPDSEHMNVYLLEGKVECSTGTETAEVSAGEMGAMTEQGEITVISFTVEDIPDFVQKELGHEKEDAAVDVGNDSSDEMLSQESLTVLVNQTTYDIDGNLFCVYDYSYDEQGYIIRKDEVTYPDDENGNLMTETVTYNYDGNGTCWAQYSDGRQEEFPCIPGSHSYMTGVSRGDTEVMMDPLELAISGQSDIRSKFDADGRLDYSAYPEGLIPGHYAVYTLDDSGHPTRIETYLEDGTHTGTCVLTWKTIQ